METLEPTTEITEPRKPGLACLLSLIVCGLGQLYNGEHLKAGLIFFGAIASGLLFGYVAWVLVVPLIFYAMYDAYEGAKKANLTLERRQAEDMKTVEVLAKLEAETITAQTFVDQIDKLNRLAKSNLLTPEEFAERKDAAISRLVMKRPRETVEDFLEALIPLVKAGALTEDEIRKIKSSVF